MQPVTKSGMEFSTCGDMSTFKKFPILEHLKFRMCGLGMPNLYKHFWCYNEVIF